MMLWDEGASLEMESYPQRDCPRTSNELFTMGPVIESTNDVSVSINGVSVASTNIHLGHHVSRTS